LATKNIGALAPHFALSPGYAYRWHLFGISLVFVEYDSFLWVASEFYFIPSIFLTESAQLL
jgi:hypothetical protein